MFTLPISSRIGTKSGAASDGVVYGKLEKVKPAVALSSTQLTSVSRVLRGNKDSSGNTMIWNDITSVVNNDFINDVAIFDSSNPADDALCFSLTNNEEISGIALLISSPANVVGTPAAEIQYRTASGWATTRCTMSTPLTSTGLTMITFPVIKYSDVVLMDDPINQLNSVQGKYLFLRFKGITGVNSSPLFTRIWKRVVQSASVVSDFTDMVKQDVDPNFSAFQDCIIPVEGDKEIIGFNEKPVIINTTIYRACSPNITSKKWVYSKSDGTFADLPTSNIVDTSNLFSVSNGLSEPRTVLFRNTSLQNIDFNSAPSITGAFSISTWICPEQSLAGANIGIVEVGSYNTETGFGLYLSNDARISLRIRRDYDRYINARVLPFNVFTHIVVTYDGVNTAKYYVNGELVATQTGRTTTPTEATFMRIGRREENSWEAFFGKIGETQIYSAELSITDVERLWNNGCGVRGTGTEPNIVDGWHFEETTGTVVNNYVSNRHGTVSNATLAAAPIPHFNATPTSHTIAINPPPDWGKVSMKDATGANRDCYWIGWVYTRNTPQYSKRCSITMDGQLTKSSGNAGIPVPETENYTKATIVCRNTSATDTEMMVINSTTGNATAITVPANTTIHTANISLPVTQGNELVFANTVGEPTNGIGDGAIYLL